MRNFTIKNNAESTEIDIFGEIGEGWFGEGITMEGIKDQLDSITSNNINLNISSLGGDVNHAFAIHDLLKMKNAKITANIIGMTASAGTVIAMGADKVNMSENALFLVHNAWTVSMGNAEDMRETAETLDKIDDRLARIYQIKTGKRKSQILSLMEEEKWITAQEARDFGFIDKVFEPTKIAASVIKDINNSKYLPNLENMNDETKNIVQEAIDTIKNAFKPSDNKLQAKVDEQTETIKALQAEKEELSKQIEANEVTTAENSAVIENHANEIETKNKEIEELKNEIEKLNAGSVQPEALKDGENPTNELDAKAKAALQDAENLFKDAGKL